MTSRKEIEKFFEDYFSKKLNLKFDENLKIKDINGFDSLEVVSLCLDFEDKFEHAIKKEDFLGDKTFSEIIDLIFMGINYFPQKPCP